MKKAPSIPAAPVATTSNDDFASWQSLTDRYALAIAAMQRHERGAREQAMRLARELQRHPANDDGRLKA
ncbi:MAG: hypothetical protein EOO24_03330 [Comamonadaceae bacterium]|nr:MAG: hypothetical protein EOO24_03330 [Comamonadaceae bacterium]